MRPEKLIKDIICVCCNNLIQQKDLVATQYKYIIEYFTGFIPGSRFSNI